MEKGGGMQNNVKKEAEIATIVTKPLLFFF